ncbi:Uncharacterised protein [Candidatus Anstonella stagnisolia]|nr:Uncharacterised protein [Candidatus Anstonella stagnisolia]
MKKFDVEYAGKPASVEFRNPDYEMRKNWLTFQSGKTGEAQRIKADMGNQNAQPQTVADGLKLMDDLIIEKNRFILKLAVEGSLLKTIEDFNKISYSDLEIIHTWFDESIGIKKGGDKENFSKT